jgi:cytochrome P450
VVREALRLYPPAWVLPRTCTRPVTLAGQTLPPGSMVVFSPYILHRRPDQYPHPTRFDPGRWLIRNPDHREATPHIVRSSQMLIRSPRDRTWLIGVKRAVP